MRISSFKLPKSIDNEGVTIGSKFKGELTSLNNVVILTGANGSGKSRFLKLLKKCFDMLKNDDNYTESNFKITVKDETTDKETEKTLTKEMIQGFNLVNYSHFDAKLQETENFSPYVIHQAKNKLKKCNYEETALNSLLYLKDLSEGYSDESNNSNNYHELREFIEFAKDLDIELDWDDQKKALSIFKRNLDDARLSPGQIYALRIAVGCKSHVTENNFFFLLDEPETHLHPNLLIKIINKLMNHFKNAQFFIATHSLPLISYLTVVREDTTVLYMEQGIIKDYLRSDSAPILNNLIGTEDEQFAIKQLFVSAEEMACNKFCMECFLRPTVVRGGVRGDPSVGMAEQNFSPQQEEPVVLFDYGAGEGRLLECMLKDGLKTGYQYNAYNVDKEPFEYCKTLINSYSIDGASYLGKDSLSDLKGKVDRVFMINVLHEINPALWKDEFKTIHDLLSDNGKLIIIEREILTMGEAPYTKGYLMLTGLETRSEAAELLFGSHHFTLTRDSDKPYIIGYTIDKAGVDTVKLADMTAVFSALEKNALVQIKRLRRSANTVINHKERYKSGLSLAFWLNQLACAIMYRKDPNDEDKE